MKTDNLNRPGESAVARTRGHVGTRAGSPGQRFLDAEGNEVTAADAKVIGAQVSGEDGELAILTITGAGQQATNNSGVTLEYGDVVVLDTDGSIITTATPQDTRPIGVVQLGGNDGDPVSVVFSGFAAQVNTTGTVLEGEYLETSATAGDARTSALRRIGSFGIALADGPNPPAMLFGVPDAAGTGVGGADTPVDHGAMGSTETIDLADGTWHRGIGDDDVTVDVQGFAVDEGVVALFEFTQDVTGGHGITWDADVDFGGADDQPNQTSGTTTVYLLASSVGDGAIYGFKVGGGAELADTVEDETTYGLTPDAGTATTASRSDHTHGTPAASSPADDAFAWMPLTTVDGGEPVLVWDGDNNLIPTLVPV